MFVHLYLFSNLCCYHWQYYRWMKIHSRVLLNIWSHHLMITVRHELIITILTKRHTHDIIKDSNLELDSLAEVDSLELRGQRRLEHRYLCE